MSKKNDMRVEELEDARRRTSLEGVRVYDAKHGESGTVYRHYENPVTHQIQVWCNMETDGKVTHARAFRSTDIEVIEG